MPGSIDPERLHVCPVLASIDSRWLPAGAAYYRACQQIADLKFSYVFLLPFLTTGGADKYVLEFIAGLGNYRHNVFRFGNVDRDDSAPGRAEIRPEPENVTVAAEEAV